MSEKSFAYSEKALVTEQFLSAGSRAVASEEHGVANSLLHPLAGLIRQVLTRSGRLELGLILIDDQENIMQALDAKVALHSVYYSGNARLSKELLCRLSPGTRIYEVASRTCKKLFENDKVSRVFALARMPAVQSLASLLHIRQDIIALEDLSIAGNIGAIMRTALAFGAGGIVLLNAEPVDIYDRRVIRASRGQVFALPVVAAATSQFIDFCRQNDLPILVMAAQAAKQISDVISKDNRLAIIVGSEKDGCSQTLMDAATLQIQIQTDAKVESLNVSTAAAIMLYSRSWFNMPPGRKQCTV